MDARPRVGLVYDERMCAHKAPRPSHPEKPDRIIAIAQRLKSVGAFQRCIHVNTREAKDDELATVHSKRHIRFIQNISSRAYGKEGRKRLARRFDSIYFNKGSSKSALLAAGSVVELSLQVAKGDLEAGAAIVRPPGHHAESDAPMGFCLYNNVAVAAHVLAHQKPELGISRVLIVDWDVHHGNGTQHMFWNDPQVLYFSVHRYDDGHFYPSGDEGNYDEVGDGNGVGFNINVPWPHGGFGDADYLAVWDYLLLPVAKEFNPDIVLISGGFDSAEGDPLGGCRLTPHGFSQMTHKLMDLAKGKVVLALEGGYNLESTAESFLSCIQILLGDQPMNNVSLPEKALPITWSLIKEVRDALQNYWPALHESSESFEREVHAATSESVEEMIPVVHLIMTESDEDIVEEMIASVSLIEAESDEDILDEDDENSEETDGKKSSEIGRSGDNEESQSTDEQSKLLEDLIIQMSEMTTKVHKELEMFQTEAQKKSHMLQIEGGADETLKQEYERPGYMVGQASDNGQNKKHASIPDKLLIDDMSQICPKIIVEKKTHVWYASYGSNMWKARFMCYLEGGKVEGMTKKCAGSRNKTAPSATTWMQIEHQLFFGHSHSRTWGSGGWAFLDLKPTDGVSTHIRLYKITMEQFNDLFVLENGGPVNGSDWINTSVVHNLWQQALSSSTATTSVVLVKDGWYGTLLCLGEKDGIPILTFTCSESDAQKFKSGLLPSSPPSEAYQGALARDLVEDLGLSKEDALNYILSKV